MTRQVLILNMTRMGDLVQMGALLARLQAEWPGVQVDVVVDCRFASAAALLPGLREVISYDFHALIECSRVALTDAVSLYHTCAAWARPLIERRYDRIVNLTFNRASALLAAYVGAPDIRGARSAWDGGMVINNAWLAYFTDMHRFRAMNRFNLVDVYAMGGSGPGAFAPLRVVLPEEASHWARAFLKDGSQSAGPWIAVQAGASDVMKAWRPEYFGATLARLADQWTGGIVFIGTPAEQDTIARVIRIYRDGGGRNVVKSAAGQTTLEQLAALLGECRLLLTNDTGPMHLAVAAGTPVIDLSVGHVDFRETGPYGPGHWVIQPELPCAPCGFDQVCAHQACKDRIAQHDVADLILHVLGHRPAPPAISGSRLYASGIDEDQLGTFELVGGGGDTITGWYAAFWRRYLYEVMTGRPSRIPGADSPPPDAAAAQAHVLRLKPWLDSLCRRADQIVKLAGHHPVPAARLQSLQQQQAAERERMVAEGLASPATLPPTVLFLRAIHNDDVQGLDRLARHHARAYHQWRTHLTTIQTRLFTAPTREASVRLPASGLRPACTGS